MDLATLWIPSAHDAFLRAQYRNALLAQGWRVGAWRKTEVSALREGLTHACLPTAAGTFFVPPDPFALAPFTAALSKAVDRPMLTVDDRALTVYARGEVVAAFARWGCDPRAVARALGVPPEEVAALLDAEAAQREGAPGDGARGEAWELTAFRMVG